MPADTLPALAAFLSLLMLMVANTAAAAPLYRPMQHLGQGLRDLPNQRNLILLSAGTAATLGALFLDDDVRSWFKREQPLGGAEKLGNIAGNGLPTTLIAFGLVGYGHFFNSEREQHAGISQLETALVDFAITHVLKYLVGRERPDGSSHTSFPSGHASRSFGFAGNLLALYGPGFGIPALLFGGFVSASRMAVDKHYLSDTVFGATIGFISGYTFALHHGPTAEPSYSLNIGLSQAAASVSFSL